MSRDPAATMRRDERGLWVNREGEVLHAVIIDQNRFLTWARTAQAAVTETIWEQFTRRSRKPPLASEATVRPADDDEASMLLRRRPTRHAPVTAAQQTFDGVPRDPRLDQLLQDSPGIVGADHPATSRKAAKAIAVKTGTQRHAILKRISECTLGLTDEELQDMGFNPNSERPRRLELLDAGFIQAEKKQRLTRSNLYAIVWTVTPKGEAALAACAAP
jgi:hypothetical protein